MTKPQMNYRERWVRWGFNCGRDLMKAVAMLAASGVAFARYAEVEVAPGGGGSQVRSILPPNCARQSLS
jgi:hypothetical protein